MEGNSFTEDLISEIISRVLAKDLVRFTCISKSWRSLILTDPYLSRLRRTSSLDRPCLFIKEIILGSVSGNDLFYHYWIDSDSLEDQSINLIEIHNPFNDDEPWPRHDARVVASCHDLLVLEGQYSIVVSNPITRKHVTVPPNPAGDNNVVFFGFGYDCGHDCYKMLTRVKHRDHSLELVVYDLDKGTWKRLQFGMWWRSQFGNDYKYDYDAKFNYLYFFWDYNCYAKCANGVVYWCFNMGQETPSKRWKMVCFDLAEEEFHVVEPPDLGEVIMDDYTNTTAVFGGKLGLMVQGLNTGHEFWTTDMDYDDSGKRQWRWTKLLTISGVPPCFKDRDFLIPVCFSACKNKILILSGRCQGNQLFWYDMVKKEFDELNNPIICRCQEGQLFRYDSGTNRVHKINNPTEGRCSDDRGYANIEII